MLVMVMVITGMCSCSFMTAPVFSFSLVVVVEDIVSFCALVMDTSKYCQTDNFLLI